MTPTRAGQATGRALLLALVLFTGRAIRDPGPTPDLTPGEIILDALDRSTDPCVTRDRYMDIITGNPMRWSETAPLNCTDAPSDTTWITVMAEDRVRHYAFGPDGCRIAVTEAACP
jgi:hypothetical protein